MNPLKNQKTAGFALRGLLALLTLTTATVWAHDPPFTDVFFLGSCTWQSTGRNPYFILEPGYTLSYLGEEDGEEVSLTITVLNETVTIMGIECRVIEERELKDCALEEISRNFFAICQETNSVFYGGEDVDIYEDGMVVSHDGQWQAGVDGARGGLIMPGAPLVGARYFQERAPGVALDQAEVTGLQATVDTPAGLFTNCLTTRETSPLDAGAVSLKAYARGVGLVEDGPVKLVAYGFR